MSDIAVFGCSDLKAIYSSIMTEVNSAYASGLSKVRIHLDSSFAYKCLVCWTPGWIRKCGPSGIWKNAKGNFCIVSFCIFIYLLGEAVCHQDQLKKIVALRRLVPVEFVLVSDQAFYPFQSEYR